MDTKYIDYPVELPIMEDYEDGEEVVTLRSLLLNSQRKNDIPLVFEEVVKQIADELQRDPNEGALEIYRTVVSELVEGEYFLNAEQANNFFVELFQKVLDMGEIVPAELNYAKLIEEIKRVEPVLVVREEAEVQESQVRAA